MKKNVGLGLVVIIALGLGITNSTKVLGASNEAETLGTARQKIISGLTIQALADLNFGEGFIGDGELTLPAAQTDSNAKFQVQGQANHNYLLTFPDAEIFMTIPNGDATKKIKVSNFTSTLNANSSHLDANGSEIFFVGGTREALAAGLPLGDYVGNFRVHVAYTN